MKINEKISRGERAENLIVFLLVALAGLYLVAHVLVWDVRGFAIVG